jgi:type II secretory pathway pseudopilin PulG
MDLRGQEKRADLRSAAHGYAMAALLVAMSIMAVMMAVAMPVWKQMAQREKEEELIFRGKQYAHAIGLFQRKFANASPPSLDVLVEQKFIRRKYKDPITNDDFVPILAGQSPVGNVQPSAAQGRGQGAGPGASPQPTTPSGQSGPQPSSGGVSGGIIGVTSKSKDQSIRIYNGRSHYNEWAFMYVAQTQAPGVGGAPGTTAPGQRGAQGRGQPGQPDAGPFGGGRGQGRGLEGQGRRGGGGPQPAPNIGRDPFATTPAEPQQPSSPFGGGGRFGR